MDLSYYNFLPTQTHMSTRVHTACVHAPTHPTADAGTLACVTPRFWSLFQHHHSEPKQPAQYQGVFRQSELPFWFIFCEFIVTRTNILLVNLPKIFFFLCIMVIGCAEFKESKTPVDNSESSYRVSKDM